MAHDSGIVKHFKRHFLLWLVFLFVVILVGGYAFGFRPGPGLTVVHVGMLEVTDLPSGSTVYADQAPRGTVKKAGSLSADLVPGNHTIIVDAPNQEPWEKIVTIRSNETTSVSPILVPKQPDPKKVLGSDVSAAATAFSFAKLPSESAPLHMGCTDVFASANRVIVSAATSTPGCTPPEFLCTEGSCAPTIIFSPAAPLRSVIPFPNRTDAVIVAAGERVYAIALDPRNPQYFAPVFLGIAPTLAPASSTAFYISDSGHTYSISF